MKKKWTLWNVFCLTGIPWFLVFAGAGIFIQYWYSEKYYHRSFEISSIQDIQSILALAMLPWMFVLAKNIMFMMQQPVGLFTWVGKFKPMPAEVSSRKFRAQHPDIPKELLSDTPDGLVLGKQGKKFVRVKLKRGNILNTIILGSTGCGKSVLILTLLLYNLHHKPTKNEKFDPMTFYCNDIKPELARKSVKIRGNKRVHVMNPEDRSAWGWDVYYNLTPDSSEDEIISEMDLIARALIDGRNNEKNAFFYKHGQVIMKAVLFWTYKEGKTFMQGILYLMNGSIDDVVKQTLEKVDDKPQYAIVKRLLSPYQGKTGEAMEGIELAFRESLDIFNKQSVRYFLEGNPQKASPEDLEQKISVFFSLPEILLQEYRCLLRLTTMQVMAHSQRRPEDSHMLTLVIDEAAVIGIDYTSFLATSRSRQIATILAFQSISQGQDCWGEKKTKSLIELCRVIAVLSCSDPDMARMLSDWVGEYKEMKQSVNNGGRNDGTYSSSYEDKKILTQADLMDLQEKKEVIAFVKGQYMRMDVEKARYYNIPELNQISEKCVSINDNSK